MKLNNIYHAPKYAAVVGELKVELLHLREEFKQMNKKYPHIQKVIDEYWKE